MNLTFFLTLKAFLNRLNFRFPSGVIRLLFCLITLILLLQNHVFAQQRIISTFAGNGIRGYSGDGGPALQASINGPENLYADKYGNIYIPDYQNRVIRKINPDGIISHVAGTGEAGFSGDGGKATLAKIGNPHSICMDDKENLYFSDAIGHLIRKISPDGIITTIAGKYGQMSFSGDGGPARDATIGAPSGIAIDKQGNIFIAEFANQIIRKISKSGIITTVAGIPYQLGHAGDGMPAVQALLNSPTGVAVDKIGNLYIADLGNNVIRKVSTNGIISHFAGGGLGYSGDGGLAIEAKFNYTYHIYVDDTSGIYLSDVGNHVIRYVNTKGIVSTLAGNGTQGFSGDGGNPLLAQMNITGGICIDPVGNIYISDRENYRIRKISACELPIISKQPLGRIICPGESISFFIEEKKGKSYSWEMNAGQGWESIKESANFSGTTTKSLHIVSASAGMKGNTFRCLVKNDCGTVISDTVTLQVSAGDNVSVEIKAGFEEICFGEMVLFTATALNPGNNMEYSWRKNGLPVGKNEPNYSDSNLKKGDSVECFVSSIHPCLGAQKAQSNKIGVQVNPLTTALISISTNDNPICQGTLVNFSAIIENGGLQPVYEWQINGIKTGSNSPTFTKSNLLQGDTVLCILNSSEYCVVKSEVISNKIIMAVAPQKLPAIRIRANDNTVCKDTKVEFTAEIEHGGNAPVFQWQKNGIPIGLNAFNFNSKLLANGDIITCTLTSNANCLQTSSVLSAPIIMQVFNHPDVSLDKNPEICSGGSRLLDAGIHTSYLWQDGSSRRTFEVSVPGVYYVTVSDANGCNNSDTVKINTKLPRPEAFLPNDTSICSYDQLLVRPNQSFRSYLWSDNSKASTLLVKDPGVYWLQVTDTKDCIGRDTLVIVKADCKTGFFVPTAFTPNGDGLNDSFKPLLFGAIIKYHFSVYNRWGQLVFASSDYRKGWDGRYMDQNQPSNIFIWKCNYQIQGEEEQLKTGSVTIIQ